MRNGREEETNLDGEGYSRETCERSGRRKQQDGIVPSPLAAEHAFLDDMADLPGSEGRQDVSK